MTAATQHTQAIVVASSSSSSSSRGAPPCGTAALAGSSAKNSCQEMTLVPGCGYNSISRVCSRR